MSLEESQQEKKEPIPIHLSPLAKAVISTIATKESENHESKITVNRFVSEIASWYEKLRNAMDYRDEEVVLRAAIERILRRRIRLGADSQKIAGPLLKELVWARYFNNGILSESLIPQVGTVIQLYRELAKKVIARRVMKEKIMTEWMYQLLSCHIARALSPKKEKQTISNFMYHIMDNSINISDDTEETKNVQVYLAVRRAFAKDDIAFLRFYLFQQLFGVLSQQNLDKVSGNFEKGYAEIERQLHYPLKEKIYMYVKRQTPVFFILEDVLVNNKEKIRELLEDSENFGEEVFKACELRYKGIGSKVRTAIIRSVVFLLVTKALFAWAIEGTYERIMYGHVILSSLAINIGIPPLLMIGVSLFIRTPNKDNSKRILTKIQTLLTEDEPRIVHQLVISLKPKEKPILDMVFALLWALAFLISFGAIIYVLNLLHFNIVSQGIFVFFIAVVSFLAYRINTTARMYSIDEKQSLFTPFVDFLVLPVVRVGMWFTEGISQINIIIFIFDFLIEIPFKAIFSFFDQLFVYLHTKRENLE